MSAITKALQTNNLQPLLDVPGSVSFVRPFHPQTEIHVLRNGQPFEQRALLKYHATIDARPEDLLITERQCAGSRVQKNLR